VVKLTVVQIHYMSTHAAMATITNIDPALKANPGTPTDAAILTIDWLYAASINGLQAWL